MPDQPVPACSLPPLPHWEETPADLPGAVREIKEALRARIAASGRAVEEMTSRRRRWADADRGD